MLEGVNFVFAFLKLNNLNNLHQFKVCTPYSIVNRTMLLRINSSTPPIYLMRLRSSGPEPMLAAPMR